MTIQTITYEELHDSVIGEYYDFKYLKLKTFNKMSLEFNNIGKLVVDTITSLVISIKILIGTVIVCHCYIYKDDKFIMNIGY